MPLCGLQQQQLHCRDMYSISFSIHWRLRPTDWPYTQSLVILIHYVLQVVLLGAGMDTRAWRLHMPPGVRCGP